MRRTEKVTRPQGRKTRTYHIPHEWDAKSFNSKTNAAGLTQFLPLTWLDCILTPGHFISDESLAQKKPWIGIAGGKRSLVLSDGTKLMKIDKDTYKRRISDRNIIDCLDMRFTPEWSIMAAVDYALSNWNGLLKEPRIHGLDKLTDGEKAKIMYLLHHEGSKAAPDFICNELRVSPEKFNKNIPSPDKWLNLSNNDRIQAYRLCLADYIDSRIDFNKFSYNINSENNTTTLFDIFKKISK